MRVLIGRVDDEKTDFVEWLISNGAVLNGLNIVNRTSNESNELDRAVYANKTIEKNTVIAKVPKKCVIDSSGALEHHILGPVLSKYDEFLRGRSAMAVWLLWEKSQGSESFFYPWLKLFPKQTNIPMLWSRSEIEELRGTYIYDRILADMDGIIDFYESSFEKTLFKNHPDLFPRDKYTLEDCIWAWNMIWSRGIELQSGASACLVPFIDFINHKVDKKLDFSLNFVQTEILIRSNDTIESGTEILRSYIPLVPNSELLRIYGFIDPENEYGATLLDISLDPSDKYKDIRSKWLEKFGIELLPYPYNNFYVSIKGIPHNVIAMLRVLSYDFEEEHATRDIDDLFDPFDPAPESIEQSAFKSIKHRLASRLESFPTSYEEDMKLLEDVTMSYRKQLAVEIRVEERVALMNCLETLQSQKIQVGKAFKVGGDKNTLKAPKRSEKRSLRKDSNPVL